MSSKIDRKCGVKVKKSLPMVCIVTSAVLWGCIGLCYKGLTSLGFTPLQVVFLRVTTAAIGMALCMSIRDVTLFRVRLKDLWMFIGTGVLSLALFNYCYFNAMEHLSVSVAASLLYTAPIFVMFMSAVLFHENLNGKKIAAVAITFVGCIMVTGVFEDPLFSLKGVLFGLGSGIGYALYSIFGIYALKKYRTETISFYTFLFASISVLPLCSVKSLVGIFVQNSVSSLVNTCLIGIGICLLPYYLYTNGLKGMSPARASVIATLEPIVACVIGVTVFRETITIVKCMGVMCIIIAIIMLQFSDKASEQIRELNG